MDDQRILLDVEDALKLDALRNDVRATLSEFYRWYNERYRMPFDVEIGPDGITLHIYRDVTGELMECVMSCVEKWKKRLTSEDQLDEFCHNTCTEDVACRINSIFCDIRNELSKCHNRHGLRYELAEGWEGYTRYLTDFITA